MLQTSLPDIEFIALRGVFPDLTSNHDDWQVIQQLRARGGCDAFVTTDSQMLSLAKEMVVLEQSRLSLVVVQDTNNDPLAAGALLVACAGRLARAFDRKRPQVFRIRLPRVLPEKPEVAIGTIASHTSGLTAASLRKAHRLTLAEMMNDCRGPESENGS